VGTGDGGGALGALVFPEEQPAMPINPAAITAAHQRVRDASGLVARCVLMCNIIIVMLTDNKHRGRHGWGLCRTGARGLHAMPVWSSIAGCVMLDMVPLLTRVTNADGTTGRLSLFGPRSQTIGWLP
jgi:hypothetical protein